MENGIKNDIRNESETKENGGKETMNTTETGKRVLTDDEKLHEGLKRIQTTIEAKKTKYNNFGKFYYRSLDDILAATKPFLTAYNMTLTFDNEIRAIGDVLYVDATATLKYGTASLSVKAQAIIDLHGKGKSPEQATGSAITYARKSAISGLFLLDDGSNDPDMMDNSGRNQQPQNNGGRNQQQYNGGRNQQPQNNGRNNYNNYR